MVSDEYKNLILFNGDIQSSTIKNRYGVNGIKFKSSHSDTETLLNGYQFMV